MVVESSGSKMSKASRMNGLNKTLAENPGPGMYDAHTDMRMTSPNVKIGTSQRGTICGDNG